MRTKYIRIVDSIEVLGRMVTFDMKYKEGERPSVIQFNVCQNDFTVFGEYVIDTKNVKINDTSPLGVGELSEFIKGVIEACSKIVEEELVNKK